MCNSLEYAETPDPPLVAEQAWIRPAVRQYSQDEVYDQGSGWEGSPVYLTCQYYRIYTLPRATGYSHLVIHPGGRFSTESDRLNNVDQDRPVACCIPL